ncbi:hypothetical protein AN958_08627 [Leucoagaricus sp. SymC.cos]|nr:hypothetical protein AN958_08627 [Leucoagaricus sp. SymC.cos]
MESSEPAQISVEELASASLTEKLGSGAVEFFHVLGDSVQPRDSNTGPYAETVSEQGRQMLVQCISHLRGICEIIGDAASAIQEIVDKDLKDVEREENAIVLNKRILSKFTEVSDTYRENGRQKFEGWEGTVRTICATAPQFQTDYLEPKLREVGNNVDKNSVKQKKKRIRQTDVKDIEPPRPGDAWTCLIAFITTGPIKKTVRFFSNRLGKQIVSIQKDIDAGKDDIHVLLTIGAQTAAALRVLETTTSQWKKLRTRIWEAGEEVQIILKDNPHIAPEAMDRLQVIMNTIAKNLVSLYGQINKQWKEVEAAYGDSRSMTREVQGFKEVAADVSNRFNQLFSSAEIVRDSHAKGVHCLVRTLGVSLAKHLQKLRSIFSDWTSCLDDGYAGTPLAMIPEVGDILTHANKFVEEARKLCREIRTILEEEVSYLKSRRAAGIQKEEARVSILISRPDEKRAATSVEALEALTEMEKIVERISKFSLQMGMGMLFYRRECYSNQALESTREAAPETFPLDPYTVDQELILDLSHLLGGEIHRLNILTAEKGESS